MNHNEDNRKNETKEGEYYGRLIVKVTSAKYAIPIEGASVFVFDGDNSSRILYKLKTNRSGESETIRIKTPPASLSESPSNKDICAYVNIEVIKDGFRQYEFFSVPVFDGVLSVQRADLIPLSENGKKHLHNTRETESTEIVENNL